MSLERTVFQALKNNAKITDQLTTYKGTPAIFFNRVPEAMQGFPLIMLKIDASASGGDAHWLRETMVIEFHVWDDRSGHNTTRLETIIREIEVAFDHQSLVDLDGDYSSARCWFQSRAMIPEGGEKDSVMHALMTMSVLAFRQFMADVLASE